MTAGAFATKPPIHKWRADQRERFEAELKRLEEEWAWQREQAAKFAAGL